MKNLHLYNFSIHTYVLIRLDFKQKIYLRKREFFNENMTLAYVSYGVNFFLYKICVFFIMLALFLLLKLYYQNLVEDVEEHTFFKMTLS